MVDTSQWELTTIYFPNKNALLHEMEVLAKTLRTLLNRKPAAWSRADEFTENMLLPKETTEKAAVHIQKLFNRWLKIKKELLEIDPELFITSHMDTGLLYSPFVPLTFPISPN